jgi:hypothetical protein
MNCHDCRNLLSDLVHDELADAHRADVDAHLASCAECAAEAAALRRTIELLGTLEPIEDPSDVQAIVAAAGVDAVPVAASAPRGRGVLVGLAAGVLLFLGLLAVSADVRYDGGRLTIAFGRPAVIDTPVTFDEYEPYVQQTAREEFSLQGAGLVERFIDALRDLDESHAEREDALIAALEQVRREDLELIEQRFLAMDEDAMHQRATMERVVTLVNMLEPAPRP